MRDKNHYTQFTSINYFNISAALFYQAFVCQFKLLNMFINIHSFYANNKKGYPTTLELLNLLPFSIGIILEL